MSLTGTTLGSYCACIRNRGRGNIPFSDCASSMCRHANCTARICAVNAMSYSGCGIKCSRTHNGA